VGKARRRGERLHAEAAYGPHEHLHGLQRLHLDPLHLWGGRGAVVSACMQRLHLDPLHLWQSEAIRGNQWRQSVAPLHLDPLHLVRSGRGSRATPSLCRGRSTGNWRSARPRS